MTTVRAYCSGCDSEVVVRVPPEGLDALRRQDVECSHVAVCGDGCLLEGGDAPLRDALEFLPGDARSGAPRELGAASRLVESARRNSLGREIRRWRLWWGGR